MRPCWLRIMLAIGLGTVVPIVGFQSALATPKATGTSVPAAENTPAYRQAMAAFRAGKWDEAIEQFNKVLKQFPQHEASRVHLAKAYFRREDMEKAYQSFRQINPRNLDAETSYEYGKVFFDFEQYEESYAAFQQVPNGHPLFDLASFYGAIAAVKLKRFVDAEKMIGNAVVLPAKLVKSRNLYRQHIETLAAKERQEQLNREKLSEEKRLSDQTRLFREKLYAEPAPMPLPAPENNKAPEYTGFLGTRREATLGIRSAEQLVDYNGYGTEESRIQTNYFQFWNSGVKTFGTKHPNYAIGLAVNLGLMDRHFTNGEDLILKQTSDELLELVTPQSGRKDQLLAHAAVHVGFEKHLGGEYWLGAQAKGLGLYPDMKASQSRQQRSAEVYVGQRLSEWFQRYRLEAIETLTTDNRPTKTTNLGEMMVGFIWPNSAGLELGLRVSGYNYRAKLERGPQESARAFGNIYADFPIGMRIGVEGMSESLQGYQVAGLDTSRYNIDSFGGRAYANVTPFHWLTVRFEGAREQRELRHMKNLDANQILTLKQTIPNFLSDSNISVLLNLLF